MARLGQRFTNIQVVGFIPYYLTLFITLPSLAPESCGYTRRPQNAHSV